MNGARYIRNDLSLVVEELLEEKDEHERRFVNKEEVPLLQLANIDFSYGPVQVLFDVNFEIHRGECVALLGTNGAGKSTILRVISGLEVQDVRVRILGDVAIIHARTSYATASGERREGRYTDVWARRDGKWLAVSAHVTR
jgi:ABC-type polysaccharide/polyol phosphate transport system ATPase subunit